jgi:hypothetical protein
MTHPTTDPDVAKALDANGLPPAAQQFLPPGPDLETRAKQLADLLRQIKQPRHIALSTTYGRN